MASVKLKEINQMIFDEKDGDLTTSYPLPMGVNPEPLLISLYGGLSFDKSTQAQVAEHSTKIGTDQLFGEIHPKGLIQIYRQTNLSTAKWMMDLGSGLGRAALQA